jgi:hypothetical protein
MALEVKLKNLVVETLNSENVSKAIFGGGSENPNVNSQQSQFIISNGFFSTAGDAQTCLFLLRGSSTDDSETELFLDGSSARFVLEDDTSYFFSCQFIARAENGSSAVMHVNGGAKRGSSANSVEILGEPHNHIIHDGIGVGDVQFSVSPSNGSLKFFATGKADTNIRWLGKIDLTQLKY